MKNLILLRHAKSSWKDPKLADIDRPLNKRGKQAAPLMAKRLTKYLSKPGLILSSPAIRAHRTAIIFAREFGYPEKKIQLSQKLYFNGIQAMRSMIAEKNSDLNTLMIVGHNPDMTDLFNALGTEYCENMPTAAFAIFNSDCEEWHDAIKDSWRLQAFEYPKMFL